jgi:hypothetical protein
LAASSLTVSRPSALSAESIFRSGKSNVGVPVPARRAERLFCISAILRPRAPGNARSKRFERGGIGVCERCGVLRSCKPLSKFVTPVTLLPGCRFTAAALTLPKFLDAIT